MPNQSEYKHGGFIPVTDYLADIARFRKGARWRLPLGFTDRAQLWLLSVLVRFSWFTPLLYVKHPYPWGPAYTLLIQYLRKKQIVDEVSVRTLLHPGYFSFYAERRIMKGSTHWKVHGHGVSTDRETALSKTLGEMLERSISGLGDENRQITFRSPHELIAQRVPLIYPPQYHQYLPAQVAAYPTKLQHNPQDAIEWVTGTNLVTTERTLIPKHLTSWFLGNRLYKRVLQHPTSNGSGAYFSKVSATLRALLEVVQRDAIMTHWLTKTPPRQISAHSLPEPLQAMINDSARIGITVSMFDITALGIPTVCVLSVTRQAQKPQVVLSAASALTMVEAITSSLEELVNIAGIFNEAEREGDGDVLASVDEQPFVSKLSARTRQLYWRGAERLKDLDWFFTGEAVSLAEVARQDLPVSDDDTKNLNTCLSVLKARGEGYYPTVYYPQNNIQSDLGFYVAQVFIPKAFPLFLTEYCGTFKSERLHDFAKAKGLPSWELNPQPHMFS